MQKTIRLNKLIQVILGLITLITVIACDFGTSNDKEVPSILDSNKLITQVPINTTDTIYLENMGDLDSLNIGWNHLIIKTSKHAENTQFFPQMTMQMGAMIHVHSAPFVTQKIAEGLAVDILVSVPGKWNFFVVQNTDTLKMKVNVGSSNPSKVYKNVDPRMESRIIMIAMDFPAKPQVGSQNIQFQAYYYNTIMIPMKDTVMAKQHKMDMMVPAKTWEELAAQFVPAKDLMLEMTPIMPTMGHGSPNNEHPVWVDDALHQGMYSGKINFSMTGDWQVDLKIEDNQGTLIDSVAIFELLVN